MLASMLRTRVRTLKPSRLQVEHQVADDLAWAVIGHLAAAVALDDRYVTGGKQVLRPPRLPLREHGGVLGEPQFVRRRVASGVGERAHRPEHVVVDGIAPEAPDDETSSLVKKRP